MRSGSVLFAVAANEKGHANYRLALGYTQSINCDELLPFVWPHRFSNAWHCQVGKLFNFQSADLSSGRFWLVTRLTWFAKKQATGFASLGTLAAMRGLLPDLLLGELLGVLLCAGTPRIIINFRFNEDN